MSKSSPRRPAASPDGAPMGYVGPGLLVRGELRGDGQLRCDGTFEGSVEIDGALIVGRSGRLIGPVQARAVAVEGALEGPVSAGELNVLAGGRLVGDVRAARIGLDDGGSLDGTVDMEVELPEVEDES